MKRARPQFMAPFVVVLGCGGPKREPAPVPSHPPVASGPSDASVPDAPGAVDASASDAAVVFDCHALTPPPTTPTACYRGHCNPPAPPRDACGTAVWDSPTTFVIVIDEPWRDIQDRDPLRAVFLDGGGRAVPNSDVEVHRYGQGQLRGEWSSGPRPYWKRVHIFAPVSR